MISGKSVSTLYQPNFSNKIRLKLVLIDTSQQTMLKKYDCVFTDVQSSYVERGSNACDQLCILEHHVMHILI